jgi:hypothetical protein
MGTFKEFIEATGVIRQDFSHLSKDERLKQGKDIGEKFIKNELLKHGVRIVSVENKQSLDTKLKIDGYLNGNPSEPVQLKLRKTGVGGDDIAYELVLGFDPRMPVFDQLKNPHTQGRDYKGQTVKHYFVLNQDETQIYHVPAEMLKSAAMEAVTESGGIINRAFRSKNGVELRPTTDNSSGIGKLMAFIPAGRVAKETYQVGQGQIQPTFGANSGPHTSMSKKDFNIAAAAERLKALQAKQKAENELRKRNQPPQAGVATS